MTKQNVNSYVGKRLKQHRTMMGLSQEAVAKAVGITFQQVQKYEKGSNSMNAERLYQLARFMKIPVAYFFEGLDLDTQVAESTAGFSETPALAFDHGDNVNIASDRESLEVMKSFKNIKEPLTRKRLADLMRAIVDHKTILD